MCDLPVTSDLADSLNCRLQSLQELTECTEKCQKQLNGLFEAFGWSNEMNVNSFQDVMEVCPYDCNHRVPQKSMTKHKASCRLSKMGYSREEQADLYDPTICYEKTKLHSLVIDKPTQQQIILKAKASAPIGRTEGLYCQTTVVSIKRKFELAVLLSFRHGLFTFSEYSSDPLDVPQNHKRSICDFTVADRLALYDHAFREASQPMAPTKPAENDDLYVDLVAKLKKDEEENGPKSHLEVLAEMRDYKRRRQSYRAKNVHITKKTYTEVIREVIDVHSGELARLWEEENELRTSRHSSHRRKSEDGRSGSVESRSSLSSSRRRRHRSRERSRDRDRDRDDRRQRDLHSPDERHHERKKRKRT